jgi:stalled ribosome rescue protein Dom34
MSLFHAVVWMDHSEAHVLQFDAESVANERIKARSHHPRHRGSDERAMHPYFEELAQALSGVQEILLVGPGLAHDEFKTWSGAHRPAIGQAIVGSEKADHPTDGQLVALARKFFVKFDRMAGTPTPT